MKLRTHYDNLKVSRDAQDFVIRAAYKALSQRYHPDKNPNPDAARIMQLINGSYRVLSDPELRAEHDAWIAAKEANAGTGTQSPPPGAGQGGQRTTASAHRSQPPPKRAVVFPKGGSSSADALPPRLLSIVADRSRGRCGDQTRIPLGPSQRNTLTRTAICLGWLVVAYGLATAFHWSNEARLWIGSISALFGIYFGDQVYKLCLLSFRPFHPSLVVTPLYVMETTWDRVDYWPISAVRDIQASYHDKGFYKHTRFTIDFADTSRGYVTDSKYLYGRIIDRLNDGRGLYRSSEQTGNQEALDAVDELKGFQLRRSHEVAPKIYGFLAGWVAGCLAYLLAFAGLVMLNQGQPDGRQPGTSHRTAPASSLNDVEMFLKLVSLNGNTTHPVHQLYIPANARFTLDKVTADNYDIRRLVIVGFTYGEE